MTKQTAGRDQLGALAPQFAALNDDVLFGEVWAQPDLAARDRSLITVSALMAQGLFPQLAAHMAIAKTNGVTRAEMVALVTHLAFYAGWPKAWSAFDLIKQTYGEDDDN